MSSFYSYGEEEIPDEEISDENSPAVTLENGDIAQPYPITTSMCDFDVQSCSPMITAVVTPYQGSTVASLEVVFDSDNAQFLEALATAGYSNNTVALWPGENPAGDYCVVKQSGSDLLVKVNYNGMKGLYDHTGTHTAMFIAIDSEGRRSYTTMTIKVTHDSGTAEGPNIFWSTIPEGTDIVDIDSRHTLTEEGMNVFINLASESGITGLTVENISDALTAEVLESLGIGLEAHMDLVNPASDKMDEGLHSLGFKTKDEIVGQKTLQFDISQFMTMLYAVAPGNTDFKLTATDASGQNIKSIMLYVPQQ